MRSLLSRSLPRAAALALAAACLGASPARAQTTTFQGTVVYEKILAGSSGLDLANPVRTPAAGIRVEVVAASDSTVLASGFTDDKGRYAIRAPTRGHPRAYVRALAQTENARVLRVDDRGEWSIVSPPLTPGRQRTVTHDLLATDSTRLAGAFNIAAVVFRANTLVRAAQPGAKFPPVEIFWDTAYADGTFFRHKEGELYINGRRGRDSDEFDDHIVAHEYGHYLMTSFSRESSSGGNHGPGEQLDPRVAWSEGWGNFFGAVTTGTSRYIDTGARGSRQIVLLSMDLEQDVRGGDRPGIWSEHSVGSVLWDWFDAQAEAQDSVALGFGPIWLAFTELARQPDAYLLRFANALAGTTKQGRLIAAPLAARDIRYLPGQAPPAPEPFPLALASGVTVTDSVDSRSTRRSNLWRSSAHYWFQIPDRRQVTLTLSIQGARDPRHADLDLYLFDAEGEPVAHSYEVNGVGGTERISQRLPAGYYRVEVRSWSGGGRLDAERAHQGTFTLVARY